MQNLHLIRVCTFNNVYSRLNTIYCSNTNICTVLTPQCHGQTLSITGYSIVQTIVLFCISLIGNMRAVQNRKTLFGDKSSQLSAFQISNTEIKAQNPYIDGFTVFNDGKEFMCRTTTSRMIGLMTNIKLPESGFLTRVRGNHKSNQASNSNCKIKLL